MHHSNILIIINEITLKIPTTIKSHHHYFSIINHINFKTIITIILYLRRTGTIILFIRVKK